MSMPEMGGGESGAAWSGDAGQEGPPTVDAAFKLAVEEGASVSATFPFFGDPAGGQLSFQIGDHIKVGEESEILTDFLFQIEELRIPRPRVDTASVREQRP